MSVHVLVADDELLLRESVRTALRDEGFEVSVAESGARAWQLFLEQRPDVVLLDLVLGDSDGLALLERMHALAPETKIILISAHGSIEKAVAAMKLGGYDFIKKPFELEELLAAVKNAARTQSLERRVAYLAAQDAKRTAGPGFIHGSRVMAELLEEVAIIARSPVPTVLVTGESGTGKQGIARLIHEASARAAGPFVELNCSALPENLVESELFGHERGAFSDARERKLGLVEVADGGTLFLDEIGDLGLGAQAKVLTFIEQRSFRRVGGTSLRHVNLRIVAATNRDLASRVAERQFREDLYYRLNAITVHLPPLRERPEDIPPLAEAFMRGAAQELGRKFHRLSPLALAVLAQHPWPGNVRELKASLARAVLMHDAEELGPEHLSHVSAQRVARSGPHPVVATAGQPTFATLEEVELAHIRRILELSGGNRTLAAQRLGITRQTLTKRLGPGDEGAA